MFDRCSGTARDAPWRPPARPPIGSARVSRARGKTYEKKSIDGETRGQWYPKADARVGQHRRKRLLLHDRQSVLSDRTPFVPRPAEQPLRRSRRRSRTRLKARLGPDLRQRPDGQAGRLGVEEGVPVLAAKRRPARATAALRQASHHGLIFRPAAKVDATAKRRPPDRRPAISLGQRSVRPGASINGQQVDARVPARPGPETLTST